MKKILLCVLVISFTISGIAQTKEVDDKKRELPAYLEDPTNEEKELFFKNLKANKLSDNEFKVIGKTQVNGDTFISVYSDLKFALAIVAASKEIFNDGKQMDRQVLLYHDRNKTPDSEQLKLKKNRELDGLMGLLRQTSEGKMFIKMYYTGHGFVESSK